MNKRDEYRYVAYDAANGEYNSDFDWIGKHSYEKIEWDD